jgi:hypothetical protein
MPCLSGGEAGCGSDGTLQVRMTNDGGFHFCAALVAAFNCPANLSGGVRRVASAIASGYPSSRSPLAATKPTGTG